MRYVAKIHVLDVLDQVVLSGYVYDADPLTDPDHEALDFSFSTPGRGVSDPIAWLATSLYSLIADMTKPGRAEGRPGLADGGHYTIYETGDSA